MLEQKSAQNNLFGIDLKRSRKGVVSSLRAGDKNAMSVPTGSETEHSAFVVV